MLGALKAAVFEARNEGFRRPAAIAGVGTRAGRRYRPASGARSRLRALRARFRVRRSIRAYLD